MSVKRVKEEKINKRFRLKYLENSDKLDIN